MNRKLKRPAWLAASIVGALLVALTAGAGAASAEAPVPSCDGHEIEGGGASLQLVAQNHWVDEWNNVLCPLGPVIHAYDSIGSGAGLNAWRANSGIGPIDDQYEYIGTDDPPSEEQLHNINEAAVHGEGDTEVAVVPVAQAAIAIIVNLPAECQLEEITNFDLERVFEGVELTWEDIGATPTEEIEHPDACEEEITRIVRFDSSGTTFQFKHYLHLINGGAHATAGGATWADLQAPGSNTSWPNPTAHIDTAGVSGGPALVNEVNGMDSSIGYANLADVQNNPGAAQVLEVENGLTHASPLTDEDEVACDGAVYELPDDGPDGHPDWDEGEDVPWTNAYGGNPNIALEGGDEDTYPICTLTYVLAFTEYQFADEEWEEEGEEIGTTVSEFLRWVIDPAGGQALIEDEGYGQLPNAGANNVTDAAEVAISHIEVEEP